MPTLPRLFDTIYDDDEDDDPPASDVAPASGIRGARTRWDARGVPYDLLSQIDGLLVRQGDSQLDDLELEDYVEPTPPPLPPKRVPPAPAPQALPSSPSPSPSASAPSLGDFERALAAQVDEVLRVAPFPVTESGVWAPPPSTSRRRRRAPLAAPVVEPARLPAAAPASVPARRPAPPRRRRWLAVSFLFVAGISIGFAAMRALPSSLADHVSSSLVKRLP